MLYAGKEGDTCEENSSIIMLDTVGRFCAFRLYKDEVLDQYNNIVQSAGSIALTGNSSLQGTRKKKELMIIQEAIQPTMRIFRYRVFVRRNFHKA